MRKSTRIIAAGLALTMMVPMLTACKKGRGGEKVASDAPWYNLTVAQINDGLDADNVDYGYNLFVGTHGDNFVFRKSGSYKLPDDFDYENGDRDAYYFTSLDQYDINGNLVTSVDLSNLSGDFSDYDYTYISKINESGDGYEAIVECSNYTTGANGVFTMYIDIDAGTCSDPVPIQDDGLISRRIADGGSNEGDLIVGDYRITKIWFSEDLTSYDLIVTDGSGNSGEVDFRINDPSTSLYNIQGIIDLGNNKCLVIGAVSGGIAAFYELDLNTLNVTKINEDMTWLSTKINNIRSVGGLGTVICDTDGVYSINYANRSIDPLFLYDYANVNAFEVGNFTPVTITENRAIFSGSQYNPFPDASAMTKTVLYIFDKADSNPNAGEIILDVASINSVSYPLAAAICSFNETNHDYYLRLDTSYQIPPDVLMASGDDSDQQMETASNNLGNQLAVDIMSGTGPDIIINGSQFGMINSPDYLLDLSEFTAENFGSDAYFTNIFDVNKIEGKLFQIPVSFGVQGIGAPASAVEAGQVGFTYDQYAAFVQGVCNGTDPINKGQLYFFINSINTMTDLMATDGTVNYDNPAFRALAEYTATNVNEVLQSDDSEGGYVDEATAFMANIFSIGYYINSIASSDNVLLGTPSYDGRGPAVSYHDSVGISAQTVAPDACKEFVSMLLGDQIQEYYGAQDGIPVNRNAFASAGGRFIEYHNSDVTSTLTRYSEAEARAYGLDVNMLDDSVVSDFASLVDSLNCTYVDDSSINAILREEIPSYLEGQKTLDQIIPVLNDRIQTVINERR